MASISDPLTLEHGPAWQHRIALAPLTNQQSNEDGTASQADLEWMTAVAAGGHSLVMTCAANVRREGKAFPGQLSIYDENHLPGLSRMAEIVRDAGSVSSVQLHHGGLRSLGGASGPRVAPSLVPGVARGLTTTEVERLRDDFVASAVLAQRAGLDGVEVHGAFGWIVAQFISPLYNHRSDRYGGDLEGRSRFLVQLLQALRSATGNGFQIGLRLSMERHGMVLDELRRIVEKLMRDGLIDYLDLAPWDIDKIAVDPPFEGRPLLEAFTDLERNGVAIGASGHILDGAQAVGAMQRHSLDFITTGRASIVDPAFPRRVLADPLHKSPQLPVSRSYLRDRIGLGPRFIDYLGNYRGLLSEG